MAGNKTLTDNLKLIRLQNIIAKFTLDYIVELEQITLDFLESVDYKLIDVDSFVYFDLEMILAEIKGEARQLIKSQSSWSSDIDVKVLNKILEIEYEKL